MLTDQRLQIIRDELRANGTVIAASLAEKFGVSEDTVRRDLRELAKAGECRRVYGGAVAPAPYAGSMSARGVHTSEEKSRLARATVKLLKPGQTLFVDSGTTNVAIARAIPQTLSLTVATNSLGVATALADHPKIELIVLGGSILREAGAAFGGETLQAISRLNADLFILGSCGIDSSQGATAFDTTEAEVKRAMAANSGGIVVAATKDKLGTAAPFRVAPLEAITHLVVDKGTLEGKLTEFRATSVKLHFA
jgi:DeoR/GlpR family transcriptional regulator of sugar metabolism